nr:fascin-like [Lytechinus pictus]
MSAMNLKYKFGLINSAGRYLTAEKFGGKVNASGASLKLKQVWTLEQDENVSYLKSHTGNYLSADKNGNVYCDCDDRANNKDTGFSIEIQDDGKWALKNVTHGRYLSCNSDELICNQSSDSNPAVHWTVQLAIHPQVCMKNVQQQLYAHLKISEDGEDRVVADEMVPWGADSTLTLVYGGKGKYCLEAFNGKFVQSDGQLVDSINEKTEYTLIFNSGNLQLRDNSRGFLGVDSGTKVLRSTSKTTKATSFVLEDSCPQGAFVLGEKYASLKQGKLILKSYVINKKYHCLDSVKAYQIVCFEIFILDYLHHWSRYQTWLYVRYCIWKSFPHFKTHVF